MHLAEILRLRARPAAGVLLALTERCPLSCAHCSTRSGPDGAQFGEEPFLRFVSTFTPQERPDLLFLSGGEPLLRPALVADVAARGRESGVRSAALSGMFFARGGRVPPAVRRAVGALDHFSASLDVHHEREVARADVLAALGTVLDLVPSVSVHVTSDDDAYVDRVLGELRRAFGERVPALVGRVRATGRARSFVRERAGPPGGGAEPCGFAMWPLVDIDGTVLACSRQSMARRHRPPHLVLGHAARDGWPEIRRRSMGDGVLRAVRAFGPQETARRVGAPVCAGYCETCVTLRRGPEVSPGMSLAVERMVAAQRPADLARRWGAGRHADAVELGWSGR
ncbi:radical SAM protein [Streptomyces avicenniae]|uniref:radical SAM protein n=1 Tax=Streptomyces avicenniae TaxID=500153 RepID=UPI00069A420B|nr:radical SAM protein [Streptomyces avicenniae]